MEQIKHQTNNEGDQHCLIDEALADDRHTGWCYSDAGHRRMTSHGDQIDTITIAFLVRQIVTYANIVRLTNIIRTS